MKSHSGVAVDFSRRDARHLPLRRQVDVSRTWTLATLQTVYELALTGRST